MPPQSPFQISDEQAEEFKAKGNAAFQAGKNDEAVEWFTKAIEIDPSNHILFSNRSAAHCASGNYAKALEDATKTTELKPDWAKVKTPCKHQVILLTP